LAVLQALGSEYRPFWVSNAIWARGDAGVVEALARRSDVAQIHANPHVKLDVLAPPKLQDLSQDAASVEWNIELVRAPEVWAAGVSGQGIIIGGQDTGYDWQHPALIDQYRGWNGTVADHTFNWHDAIHENNPNTSPGNMCGFDSPQPCDDHGHGTHTMGTMVGDDGGNNQIGMAPDAQWIACRNMEQGWGTPATYTECYEWFIAPYPLGGDPMVDGDPAKAPHVINNSWSCPVSEGCTDPDILKDVVENVREAGIITVHSAGNAGPSCSSVSEPAAIYDASFGVAATSFDDVIAGFSSRGPVTKGDNNPAKPDISAPGVGVRSSYPGDLYTTMSGTSMAAPHVAGLAALIMAAQPDLVGNVDALEQAIMESAAPLYTDQGCGGDDLDSLPNHVYGWGRIDAKEAHDLVEATPLPPTPTNTPVPPTATSTPPSSSLYVPILIDR
jgi:subtilisin family serine protease